LKCTRKKKGCRNFSFPGSHFFRSRSDALPQFTSGAAVSVSSFQAAKSDVTLIVQMNDA
jgi:hypothetical protein